VSDEKRLVRLQKRELSYLNYLIKLARKSKTTLLTVPLSQIAVKFGCDRSNVYRGLKGLQSKGVIDLTPTKNGYIIGLTRVFDKTVIIENLEKSGRNVRRSPQKEEVGFIGSVDKSVDSPNPTFTETPVSSIPPLQNEEKTEKQPVVEPLPHRDTREKDIPISLLLNPKAVLVSNPGYPFELFEWLRRVEHCALSINNTQVLSLLKNFNVLMDYKEVYKIVKKIKKILMEGK
jgi:DNA-binding MarR family transcriptional regulator